MMQFEWTTFILEILNFLVLLWIGYPLKAGQLLKTEGYE